MATLGLLYSFKELTDNEKDLHKTHSAAPFMIMATTLYCIFWGIVGIIISSFWENENREPKLNK